MASIDERIVHMKFENGQFLRGVQSTLSGLDKLRQGLNFKGAQRSIGDLQGSFDKFSLGSFEATISSGGARAFNALEVAGMTVINRLTNSAMDMGKKITSSLMEPIVEGGKRRAMNIEQAEFMFEGLGANIEEMMGAANEAVKGTAYGLDEAAVAASQFYASGIQDADEMTNALRGISGAAAMTSSEYGDMSRIFTSVAGNGRVMGNDLLSMSSRGLNAAATLRDYFIEVEGQADMTEETIREMVTKGEIDFETFAKAMNWAFGDQATKANETFSGSLSNMRAALARIGAAVWSTNLVAMRDVFNSLTPVIDSVKTALSPLIGDGEELTGVINDLTMAGSQGLVNMFESLEPEKLTPGFESIGEVLRDIARIAGEIGKPLKDAFSTVFTGSFSDTFNSLAAGLANITSSIDLAGRTGENLKRTFAGVFAIFSIAGQIIGGFISVIGRVVGAMFGASGGVLEFTGGLGDFLVAVDRALKEGNLLSGFFEGLGKVLAAPFKVIGGITRAIQGMFEGFDSDGGSRMAGVFSAIGDALGGFGQSVVDAYNKVKEFLQPATDWIKDAFDSIKTGLSDAIGDLDFSVIFAGLNAGLLAGIGLAIRNFFNKGLKLDLTGGIAEKIGGIFGTITDHMKLMQAEIKADILIKIAIALGILTLAIMGLATVDPGDMAKAMAGMAAGIGQLVGALALLNLIKPTDIAKLPVMAASMILLATAMLILAAAVKKMGEIDLGDMVQGLVGVGAALGIMVGAVKLLQGQSKGLIGAAIGIGLLAGAMLILAEAVKAFGDMSVGELAQGLIGLAIALGLIAGAMRLMPKGMAAIGAGLVIVGAGLLIVSQAISSIGNMDIATLAKGIGGIAVALGVLAGMLRLMPKGMVAIGAGLVVVGAGLKVVADAISTMGNMDIATLAKGIGGVAAALLVLAGALRLMPKGMVAIGVGLVVVGQGLQIVAGAINELGSTRPEQMVQGLAGIGLAMVVIAGALRLMPKGMAVMGAGLILVAQALKGVADAVTTMGGMSVEEIAKGLVALGGSLLILAGALKLMQGSLGGAAALMVAAVGINMLVGPLMALSSLSWQELLIGLGALGGALLIIGGAAVLLTPAIPAILGLAAGLVVLSAAMLVAGGAIALIATGMSLLGDSTESGMDALMRLVERLPEILATAGKALVSLIVSIAEEAGNLFQAFGTLLTGAIQTIAGVVIDNAPVIAEAFVTVIVEILKAIQEIGPEIIETFKVLILSLLEAVIELTPVIGEAVIVLITTLLDILVAAVPQFVDKGMQILTGFLQGIANNIGNVVTTAVDIIVNFINAISDNLPRVIQAGVEMMISFINGIADGIRNNQDQVIAAATNLGEAIIEGLWAAIKAGASRILSAIGDVVNGAMDWAKSLLGINSPSKEFMKIGNWIDEGLEVGIESGAQSVMKTMGDFIQDLLKVTKEGTEEGIEDIESLEEAAANADVEVPDPKEKHDEDDCDKPSPSTSVSTGDKRPEYAPYSPPEDYDPPEPREMPQLDQTEELRADNDEFHHLTQDRIEDQERMTDSSEEMAESVDGTRESLEELGTHLKQEGGKTNQKLRQIAKTMAEALNTASEQPLQEGANTLIEGLKDSAEQFEEVSKDVVETAEYTSNELTDIFSKTEESAEESNETMLESFRETMREMLEFVKEVRGTISAISDGVQAVRDLAKHLDYSLKRIWGGAYLRRQRMMLSGRDMGHAIVTGMDDGMEDGFKNVEAQAEAMGKAMVYQTERSMGFHNRENEFEKMGFRASSGLSGAFKGWLGLPGHATSKTTKRVFNEMLDEWVDFFEQIEKNLGRLEKTANAISSISDLVNRVMEFSFDFSAIQSGINWFSGAIGDFVKIAQNGLPALNGLGNIFQLDWLNFFNFGGMVQSGLNAMVTMAGGILAGTPIADAIAGISGASISASLMGGFAGGMLTAGIIGVIGAAIAIIAALYIWSKWFGQEKLEEIGMDLGDSLIAGLLHMVITGLEALDHLLDMDDYFDPNEWRELGMNLMEGLIRGVFQMGGGLLDAIRGIFVGTIEKLFEDLGIKEMTGGLGKLSRGLSGVLEDIFGTDDDPVSDRLDAFGDDLIAKMRGEIVEQAEEIEEDLSIEPTITPVIDMSKVDEEAHALYDEMHGTGSMSYDQARSIIDEQEDMDEAHAKAREIAGETTVFNQYNNSPKALSEIEIYRRTQNQLSLASKGGKPGDRV